MSTKAMLIEIIKGLVDDPGSVEVEEAEDRNGIVYEVSVAEDDLGKVIGKDGKIANALRAIAKSVTGEDDNRRVHVEIRS
ncbi:MAG: KH domain-containing protein [Armatimonadetes bacterium]|nr:KH domain-containing protein [Armatimonadota bacterium]